MLLKSTKSSADKALKNSTIEQVNWPVQNVLAIQTTRNNSIGAQAIEPSEIVAKSLSSPFQSFNLALHVNDDVRQVTFNRSALSNYIANRLSSEPIKIQWLEQIHGSNVCEVLEVSEKPLIADASITRSKHVALAIMTADCLPILLADKAGQEIAAIHGGWRPLAANIVANTIDKMTTQVSDIVAWLGPCIGAEVFEVGEEVYNRFVKQNNSFSQAFSPQANNKYLASLHGIAKLQLNSLGVNNIYSLDECTYSQSDKYYSYRKQSVTGRMATLICRK